MWGRHRSHDDAPCGCTTCTRPLTASADRCERARLRLLRLQIIATRLEAIYGVSPPELSAEWLNFFEQLTTFGLTYFQTVPMACLGFGGFLPRLQFWMALPAVVGSLLVLGTAVRLVHQSRFSGGAVAETSIPWLLRLMFLIYPVISASAFDAWACYDFDTGDPDIPASFFRADVSVVCGSSAHDEILRWAVTAVVIYVAGLWLFAALLLAWAYPAILTEIQGAKPTRLSSAIRFLHAEFRPLICWWELLEMARRAILLGFFRLLDPGSIVQISLATLTCLVYLLLQLTAAPYRTLSDGWVANASSLCLVVLFLWATYSRYGELNESLHDRLSPEQRRVYRLEYEGAMCFAAVAGALFFTLCLLGLQVYEEVQRRKVTQRNINARRLRYVRNEQEVRPPRIAKGGFHLFLSHVWSSGQDQMRIVKTRLAEMMPDLVVFLDVDDLKVRRRRRLIQLLPS